MTKETKKERLNQILQNLKEIGGIQGAAVITRDGLLIASELSEKIDGETLAAMTATMSGAAETAMAELHKKEVDRVIAESVDSKLITTGAGAQVILVCMLNPKSNLGLILLEMKKAAKSIKLEIEK